MSHSIINHTKLCLISGALALSGTAHSWQQVDNRYIWEFLSNETWPGGYNQNTGKPEGLIYSRDDYPAEFFQRINNALPESYVNEAFLTSDAGANITLQEQAEVFITFIHEGAGYKNSFGYFTFDAENPPTTAEEIREVIVFPNLSYPHLTNGHRLSIGTFPAGTSIGFFIAANGFSYYTGVKDNKVPYYYSLNSLNPDPEGLKQHNVLLYDEEVEEVILGFEDLPRAWGDNDFNDAVFSVKASPARAIFKEALAVVPEANDSDADGVIDSEDAFPNNYRRAFAHYYPSNDDWMTLAFEDNWPENGDYDMNDLVVRERMTTIYNATGAITGFKITGFIDARGAAFSNGFAIRLMGVDAALHKMATITLNGDEFSKSPEANQTDLVYLLWQNSKTITQTGEDGSCSHFNTVRDCGAHDSVPFEFDVEFDGNVSQLSHGMMDFFIFRTNYRGREIHFADFPPTDLFDVSQFGKFDDTSDPKTGRYFRNQQNLPWALKIPGDWRHPLEYIDVLWAFPDYEFWVESSGREATDWYLNGKSTHQY